MPLYPNTISPEEMLDPWQMMQQQGMADLLKYALIVVSTAILKPFFRMCLKQTANRPIVEFYSGI